MRSINLFNPFTYKESLAHSGVLEVVQEVVFYSDSRFRVILNAITKAENDRKKWLQILLQRELVST
jgi:hypothetical protein